MTDAHPVNFSTNESSNNVLNLAPFQVNLQRGIQDGRRPPPPFPLKFWGNIFVNYDACKKAKKKKSKLSAINR